MSREAIRLRSRQGPTGTATAAIQRFDPPQRIQRAIGAFAGGILVGGLSILVPGPHLVLTWLGPVVGVALALRGFDTSVVVRELDGSCPDCGHPIREARVGGLLGGPMVVRCPSCTHPIEVLTDE